MQSKTVHGLVDPETGGENLAEDWASLTKDQSVYPQTNIRVRKSLDRFLSKLREGSERGEGISIVLNLDHVKIGEEQHEISSRSNVAWLKARLDDVGLAGAEFSPSVSAETLTAFTKKLLDGSKRKRPLENEGFLGLSLIERSFVPAGEGGRAAGLRAIRKPANPQEEMVFELLESKDSLWEKIDLFGQPGEEGEAGVDAVDLQVLLAKILELVPAETMQDPGKVVELTEGVLDELLGTAELVEKSKETFRDCELSQLMHSVSKKLFSRFETAEVKTFGAEKGDKFLGHPGDDLIQEDLEALLDEVKRLPRKEIGKAELSEPGSKAEQFGVFLLVNLEREESTWNQSVRSFLETRLSDPSEEVLGVVATFLDPRKTRLETVRAFTDLLKQTGHLDLARRAGAFDPSRLLKHFPAGFFEFLDSLDGTEEDLKELEKICIGLGTKKILDNKNLLIQIAGFSEGKRASTILSGSSPAFLPLIAVILEETGSLHQKAVLRFLLGLKLTCREACLLGLVREAGDLPLAYLKGLCSPDEDGNYSQELHRIISDFLVDFLEFRLQEPGEQGNCLVAIDHLGHFRTNRSREFLDGLLAKKGLFSFQKKDRKVRKAARKVLERYP